MTACWLMCLLVCRDLNENILCEFSKVTQVGIHFGMHHQLYLQQTFVSKGARKIVHASGSPSQFISYVININQLMYDKLSINQNGLINHMFCVRKTTCPVMHAYMGIGYWYKDKWSEWSLVRTEWLKTCQSANDWGVPAFGMLGQNWGYHLTICPWGVENTLK
jgi:hypothetical protein